VKRRDYLKPELPVHFTWILRPWRYLRNGRELLQQSIFELFCAALRGGSVFVESCHRPGKSLFFRQQTDDNKTWISCNTSSAVYFAVSTSADGGILNGNPASNYPAVFPSPPNNGLLNISIVADWWRLIANKMSQTFAPVGKLSLLNSCLVANELASLRIAYYGTELSQ
jgi:hypothetical protein